MDKIKITWEDIANYLETVKGTRLSGWAITLLLNNVNPEKNSKDYKAFLKEVREWKLNKEVIKDGSQ